MSSKLPPVDPAKPAAGAGPGGSGSSAVTKSRARISRTARHGPQELSFAQQRLWFLDQLEPNSASYNTCIALELVGALDVGRLTTSLDEIIARHESLRTTFVIVDGQPRQLIAQSLDVDVPMHEAHDVEQARQLVLAESQLPFDLSRGPLLRVSIVRLGPDKHWLLLSMHHIVADGWSMGILIDELSRLYGGGELPPLPVQYPDFAIWQRSWLSGEVLERQVSYWRKQLSRVPELLELPTDRPRPPVIGHSGATYWFEMSAGLTRSLKALSRKHSTTLFMTCLAAFQTLLFRYSRQEDIAVGAPIANRNRSETQPLIGFFVNTIVLRADLSGNPTFSELLARVREVVLGGFEHADLPFEKLVEELRPERNLSHSPLFQVLFALDAQVAGPKLADLDMSLLLLDNGTAKFDLSLGLDHRGDRLGGGFEYRTDLFDEATIVRMAGHFQCLLEAIVADPDQTIGDLPLLTDHERHQILVEWNQTAKPFPQNVCVHELIEQQVDRTPDAVALVHEGAHLTYRQLDDRANQLAHYLIKLGARPETRVGLCIGRSLDMMVALIGIFKAGAAYMPLAPDYPEDRLSFMLEDSAVPILITEQSLANRLAPFCPRLVCMDSDWRVIANEPTTRPDGGGTPENLAYVIYTSGSTGRPKGVQVEHRSVVNLLVSYGQLEQLTPADRSLQFSSVAFDGSVNELFAPLVFGAVNVLRGDDIPTPAELLGERFEGVTAFNMATAYWHTLVTTLLAGELKVPRALRLVNIGGERVLPERVAAWHDLAPGCKLQNVYGPAETTDVSTTWLLRMDELVPGREVPIGRPLPNYTVYVLDARMKPVPVGVPGECYIGGVGVARGYLDRPELTAERFVENPFGPGRLYRTGDFVRWFPNGNLEFIGRVDHQVKIRGFRIELGEIEAALSEHPNVQVVVVVTRDVVPGEKRLVAYVVGKKKPMDTADLRAFLAAKLPDYMVPRSFVVLDEIPLTSNGKVDTRALPAPDWSALQLSEYVEPRTELERQIAAIWAHELGLERVGADDNFFELGGHSLLATQVIMRIRTKMKIEVPLRALFEAPTVASLSRILDASDLRPTHSPIVPASREGELPLSFAQQRLWFLDQLEPNSALYNTWIALELVGALDLGRLTKSLDSIIARHESLRTTFVTVDGQPRQVIARSLNIDVSMHEAHDLEHARQLAMAETQLPFDLARGPLFRVRIVKLGPDTHWLLLVNHHIVTDGWSMELMIDELSRLYGGRELPPLPVQYPDYAIWQRGWLSGEVLEAQLAYWKTQLSGMPQLLELPTDRPRPPVMSYCGATYSFAISAALTRSLEALSLQHSTTMFMTCLAAFQTLLYRYSRQADVAVGTPVAGRTHAETEALIGFFVNTLVLRTDLSGNPTFRELLGRVREVALGAYAHQDVPFEKLVEEVQPERSLGHAPLFQVMFALDNTSDVQRLAGFEQQVLDLDVGTSKFDMTLTLAPSGQGLGGRIEYRTDLFDASTIERFAEHYNVLLAAIVADVGTRIGELAITSARERAQMLVDWNDTAKQYPDDRVHTLFEEQVRRTPTAVAVEYFDVELTYAELDAKANQLAHRLARLGVGRDVLVGVALGRSPDMVIALLAILKAGGAYVPLDPSYPRARLHYMIEDSRPAVLLLHARQRSLFEESAVQVLLLDEERSAIAAEPTAPLVIAVSASDLAYVIYTSGSTGRPKGVAIEHRGLSNYLHWAVESYSVDAAAGAPVHSSLSFDLTVTSLYLPLLVGSRVTLVEGDDVESLSRSLERRGGHGVVKITPAHFDILGRQLSDQVAQQAARGYVIGGEALRGETLDMWRRKFPDVRLWNEYGPTETVVGCCVWELPVGARSPVSPPIGRPIANTQLYVLDEHLQPCPIGVPGELYIGGAGVARGYLNNPELTSQRFVRDPFSKTAARMYRTGDLVKYRADGILEYLGRIDFQVKVRGFRIELGEIESAIAEQPGVQEVVVVAREDAPGDKRLVAYVTGRPDVDGIRMALRARLPQYMVPSAFVAMDALPLSPNGKIDRRALPSPDRSSMHTREHVPPRTPSEQLLAKIWEEVLGLDRVGTADNFFELGGHSLLATQVISRIRTAMKLEVPLRTLFEAPTVAALSHALDAIDGGPTHAPIVPTSREGELPLSFAQQRLWFLDQLEPNSAVYNVPLALRLVGALDLVRLIKSLGIIVARHESLRTTFVMRDGQPRQVIAASLELDVPVLEARDVEHARGLALVEAERPFDLVRGPLVRASVLGLGPDEHWLLLSMHHIVTDGWSMSILIKELSHLYGGGELPPLAVQYLDFAVWQQRWLSGEVLVSQLAYWKTQLSGNRELLELPTDRPRPPVMSHRGATYSFEISAALTHSLEALSRQHSATLFMTCLAAFKTLLSRYTRQEDIVVGSPLANRNRAETESVVGFFVNTIVLRTDLSGHPTFRELLERVREVALGAYAHQDLPFEKLVEELQPSRSLSQTPLFQVMFALDTEAPRTELAGLDTSDVVFDDRTAKFDLSVGLEHRSDGLAASFQYSTDLFDEPTIARMAGHLQCLFQAIVADPEQTIDRLPLLTDDERRQLVSESAGKVVSREDVRLHTLVEAQARRRPEAIAVRDGATALTYGELDARASRLARRLVRMGVRPDSVVALLLERSLETVVAQFAVLKAGGAFMLVDPSLPPDRIGYMLADTRSDLVLYHERTEKRRAPLSGRHIAVDIDLDEAELVEPVEMPGAQNLAYVIYTSGSTGRPKGAMIPHAAVVNLVGVCRTELGITEDDRQTFVASPGFDAVVLEIWPTLAAGASLHVVDDEVRASPELLWRRLEESRITLCWLPTPLAELALERAPQFDRLSLRCLHTGGDRLRRGAPVGAPFRFLNSYGPSEAAVIVSADDVNAETSRPSIGHALENMAVYILDAQLEPVPRGIAGDLYIGGVTLGRGYLGRPDLTADRFIPDPFDAKPGARLYRTGDLARHLPDGRIDFIGRIDHQVKIRGQRIELGEIEIVLATHPSVSASAVVVKRFGENDDRLVAYVAPRDIDVADVRSHLARKLPEYMVPSVVIALESLPLTPSGKLDRRALPAPDRSGETGRDYVAPRTPSEEILTEIWSEVLHIDRVSTQDNFFELGGHSLLATQVISRIRARTKIDVPVRALFEAPTVARMSGVLDAAAGRPTQAPIVPAPRDRDLPPSFAQQRLWFLDQLEPNSAWYNLSFAIKLVGALDVGRLRKGLNTIIARHESLRTTFHTHDGQLHQVIAPSLEVEVPVREAHGVEHARQLAQAEAERPFDLARGPLLRASIVELGPDEHWLLLSMHHIVSDGWSMGVLFHELSRLYGGGELPPLPLQYPDFAIWQRNYLSGEVLEAQLSYWKTQLSGVPDLLELPTDRPRPPMMSYRGAAHSFGISADLARSLEALSQQQSATMFMACLAAFKTLLMRYSRQEDIVIGSPIANRNRAETEPLIGFFANTVVLRTDLSGNPTFRELLGRVREVALSAYAHQDLPFEKLVEELQPDRSLSYTPLFQVLFALQNMPQTPALPGLEQQVLEFADATSKFDLSLYLAPSGQGLVGTLEYSTDLFDAATIERFAEHYKVLLESIVKEPSAPVGRLEILTAAERRQLITTWNDTGLGFRSERCLHHLMEEQVDRTPDGIAVEAHGERVTYAELDRRANQIAHRLRELGAGPGIRVGVLFERSVDMVIAIVGILKTGAAYVPLDFKYPGDRLAYMLEHSQAAVLLTHSTLRARLPTSDATKCFIDLESSGKPTARGTWEVGSDNLAYVIYTSGSTGKPKGVAITHRNLVNLCAALDARLETSPGVWLAMATVCFDMSGVELLWTFTRGFHVVVHPDLMSSPDGIADLPGTLLRHRVTHLQTVPSLYGYILSQPMGREAVGQLSMVLVGGEALPQALADELVETGCGTVLNMYGPTETTIWSSSHRVVRGGVSTIVGRPLGNTQFYVLDAGQTPVPIGVPGELFIAGEGVAQGYWRQPELTEERFLPDPFGAPGTRMYRTGDLVRVLPDGTFDFIGRADSQVKIRGFRIELGEIEVVLRRHASVREAVVIAREDTPGQKRLIAYVVGHHSPPDTAELRAALEASLPDYMIPAMFMTLDAMPLNPNGKIDRKALPAPDFTSGAERTYVAPRTQTEREVATIFEQLLGVQPVGADDNFFLLGGHSLLAVQLCSMIRARLGAVMPLATMFMTRTVEATARAIDERATVATSNLVPMRREGSGVPLVMVHPLGGTVFRYLDLVGRLAPGRPCYAIQAQGVSEGETPAQTIEDMARQYLELIDETLEGGPCHLFGWSFGGLVVMEMARQRARAGKQVASVTLLDSFAPEPFSDNIDPLDSIGRFAFELGLGDLQPSELVGMGRDQALAHVVARATKASVLPPNIGVAELSRLWRVFDANVHALGRYQAEPLSGDVTLITASESSASDPTHGISALITGTLTVRETPGDHYSILRRPGVDRLAKTLDELLSAAEPPGSSPNHDVKA